ncbi:hypothetical protein TEA_025734 [Camellia sinensis var. sinensis]|uniref:Uncharacterized protein n=1 Tax=Camellia sinensis var. sinensis TaxID=542762 RepID=A0A4S4DCV7_CAMSN|nr:hypothetical protein TEA_025734 [Camellia sinensis var. sinensis]
MAHSLSRHLGAPPNSFTTVRHDPINCPDIDSGQLLHRRTKGRVDSSDVELHENLLSLYNNDASEGPAVIRRVAEKLQLMEISDLTQESIALHEMVSASGGDPGEGMEKMSMLLKKIKEIWVCPAGGQGEIAARRWNENTRRCEVEVEWCSGVGEDPKNPGLTGQAWVGGLIQKGSSVLAEADDGTTYQVDVPEIKGKGLRGPRMIQLNLDGKRLYVTNSLFTQWDHQFYPDVMKKGSHMLQIDVNTEKGGLTINQNFFVEFGSEPDGHSLAHEMRYPGRDCTSDLWI